ncbi:MAG: Txe/YoeB family addiction module toxin [Flavobacteriales bacterium]|jgi:toxin YoeB|nr:Txe/YoeB family addiction module toxin [Flavobacteriales bacterium]NCA21274.1 Txe/YoeB family addiction module toxin [Crocinitomicaceae bacterium]
MAKYQIVLKPNAEKDLSKHKKAGNQATIKKINSIFRDLEEHPYEGVGQPEELKHNLSGLWSRRINQKDRLIYEVEEEIVTVYVISAMGHYSDK